MDTLLIKLKALADLSRLRLVFILQQCELTVSELTDILEQSQPRVSRHLKILTDACLLNRFQEGSWVFYRQSDNIQINLMLKNLLALSQTLHFQQDMQRLQTILHEKQKNAQAFFSEHAASWGALQSIYYHNQPVEAALKKILHGQKFDFGVDLGTGTGYMLQFLAPYINKGLGIDLSKEMLFHARSALDKNSFSHLQVRYGDLTDLTLESASVDLVTLHLVLHYFDNPSLVLKEASRILKNNGTLIVVDFDCHTHEDLREKFKHRRLGFSEQDIEKITKKAALCVQEVINIDDTIQNSDLHVKIWRIAKV